MIMEINAVMFWIALMGVLIIRGSARTANDWPPEEVFSLKPLIESVTKTIDKDAGDDLVLTCRGQKEVHWVTNSRADIEHDQVEEDYDSRRVRPFSSKLSIANITHNSVGLYYCLYDDHFSSEKLLLRLRDIEVPTNNDTDQVYVFVRDENHLLTDDRSLIPHMTNVSQVVNICKPTFPGVKVTIDTNFTHYDPKVGFSVEVQGSVYYVTCCATYKEEEKRQEHIFHFSTDPLVHEKPILRVTDLQNNSFIAFAVNDGSYGETSIKYSYDLSEGTPFILDCSRNREGKSHVFPHWVLPPLLQQNGNNTVKHNYTIKNKLFGDRVRTTLQVRSAEPVYTGEYRCSFNRQGDNGLESDVILLNILPQNERTLELHLEQPEKKPSEAGLQWWVRCMGYKNPMFIWSKGDEVLATSSQAKDNSSSSHYILTEKLVQNLVILEIVPWTLEDTGYYTLKVQEDTEGSEVFENIIWLNHTNTVSPTTPAIEILQEDATKEYFSQDAPFEVHCSSKGFPMPSVELEFSRCFSTDNCTEFQSQPKIGNISGNLLREMATDLPKSRDILRIAQWEGYGCMQGRYRCVASNDHGTLHGGIKDFFFKDGMSDSSPKIQVWINGEKISAALCQEVVEGDDLTISCRLCGKRDVTWSFLGEGDEKHNITWNLNGSFLQQEGDATTLPPGMFLQINESVFAESVIHINNIPLTKTSVTFVCSDAVNEHSAAKQSFKIIPMTPPTWLNEPQPLGNHSLVKTSFVVLNCSADGVPSPVVKLFKDDELLEENDGTNWSHPFIQEGAITFRYLAYSDAGSYRCEASNRAGKISSEGFLTVFDPNILQAAMLVILFIVIFFALPIVTINCWTSKRSQKRASFIFDQKIFEQGDTNRLNPDLGLHEQAELLPYIKEYEVPQNMICKGKLLGGGAFGRVYRATISNLRAGEPYTTVALKTTKDLADSAHRRALCSELKIMMHIGKHANIVNLMGACSENFASKGELFVLVEYCKFGNLLDYMHKTHRFSNMRNNTSIIHGLSRKTSIRRKRASGAASNRDVSAATMNPSADGGAATKEAPDKYCNVVFDNVPFKDVLISWAFQIARGMEFLASKKVLHGDLAARNILLSEERVVKISDFGLAKDLYKTKQYMKKSRDPVPWRWLAPECLRFGLYSTQSDIWSFGILLWEIFSLGEVPFRTDSCNEDFVSRLAEGYHCLSKPKFADDKLYGLMKDCWNVEATGRPSFTQLQDDLGKMLSHSERQQCININQPYQENNHSSSLLRSVQTPDYTSKMLRRSMVPTTNNDDSNRRASGLLFSGVLPPRTIKDVERCRTGMSTMQQGWTRRDPSGGSTVFNDDGYIDMGRRSILHKISAISDELKLMFTDPPRDPSCNPSGHGDNGYIAMSRRSISHKISEISDRLQLKLSEDDKEKRSSRRLSRLPDSSASLHQPGDNINNYLPMRGVSIEQAKCYQVENCSEQSQVTPNTSEIVIKTEKPAPKVLSDSPLEDSFRMLGEASDELLVLSEKRNFTNTKEQKYKDKSKKKNGYGKQLGI